MRLIDADILVKHLEEIQKTADKLGNYDRAEDVEALIALVKAEKTVMENGDITPTDALDATARLVDRVLEILPNIVQSVIDAMPDAIEKYLRKSDGDYEEAVQIHLEKRSNGEREAYMQGWKAGFEAGKRQIK